MKITLTELETTVKRPCRGYEVIIQKLPGDLLYICTEKDCGEVITSLWRADLYRDVFTHQVRCPLCKVEMTIVVT